MGAQLIGNHFCDHFSSIKVRKTRKNFATVFFGAETGSQLTLQELIFGFKDKFHAEMIGNHFCDYFSSKIVRKSRKKFATVFFGAETGSQLRLQKLIFGFNDKFHAQLIGNNFCDHFSSKKLRKTRKNFATVFFGAQTGSQLTLQKLVFGFKDKFHVKLIGNHFSDDFSSKKGRKTRKNFATVFFGSEAGSQLEIQKLVFGFKDKFHAQLI